MKFNYCVKEVAFQTKRIYFKFPLKIIRSGTKTECTWHEIDYKIMLIFKVNKTNTNDMMT